MNLVNYPPSYDFLSAYSDKLAINPTASATKILKEIKSEINMSVYEFVDQKGLPFLVKNLNHHPLWNPKDSNCVFSFDFLDQKYGNKEIPLRNNESGEDVQSYTLSSYFSYLRINYAQRNPKLLYGKDLSCPSEWSSILTVMLPSSLQMKGSDDLLRYLPAEIQPECLMIYIGGHGTFTPFHVDICGSVGHNLMVAKDLKEAGAIWTIIPTQFKDDSCKYWGGIEFPSSTDPSKIVKPSSIGYPNSIELDGLLITDDNEFVTAPFPVYQFVQDIGDLVIIPPGSPHQVRNINGATIKAAWNRITGDSLSSYLSNIRKTLCKKEVYRTRAICHYSVVSLTAMLEGIWLCHYPFFSSSNAVRVPAAILHNVVLLIKLLDSYKLLILDEYISQVDFDEAKNYNPFQKGNVLKIQISKGTVEFRSKEKHLTENYRFSSSTLKVYVQLVDLEQELPHTRICDYCYSDLLNRFFHCSECVFVDDSSLTSTLSDSVTSKFKPKLDGIDLCMECYSRGRYCRHPIMTLMQTFESIDALELVANRASNCVQKWINAITGAEIEGTLPSTKEDMIAVKTFIDPRRQNQLSGPSIANMAFNVLMGRLDSLFDLNERDRRCSGPCMKLLSIPFIALKCSVCSDQVCQECTWNYYGINLFELTGTMSLDFCCKKCKPMELTLKKFIEKKVNTILPWLGCLTPIHSPLVFNHLTPSYLDTVVFEISKKIYATLPGSQDVAKIIYSYFTKSSESKMAINAKSNTVDVSYSRNYCNNTQSVLNLNDNRTSSLDENFETALTAAIDLPFGLAVKARESKRLEKRNGKNIYSSKKEPRLSGPILSRIKCPHSRNKI